MAPHALDLFKQYNSDTWENSLNEHLSLNDTLRAKYALERSLHRIPVKIKDGQVIDLSPGIHSDLIRAIIENF